MSADRRALATSLEGIAAYLEHHEDDAADLRAAAAVLRQDADLAAEVDRLRAGITRIADGLNFSSHLARSVRKDLLALLDAAPENGGTE